MTPGLMRVVRTRSVCPAVHTSSACPAVHARNSHGTRVPIVPRSNDMAARPPAYVAEEMAEDLAAYASAVATYKASREKYFALRRAIADEDGTTDDAPADSIVNGPLYPAPREP